MGGERIVDRLVNAFYRALGELPLLVANAPEATAWRLALRVVPDVRAGTGSLGGIYTAAIEAPAPVVCVAWDMPFVTSALIAELAQGLRNGYDVFLPESGSRRGVEPMCAGYGAACAGPIAERLAAGDFRAVGFHPAVRVGILPLDRVRAFGDPEHLFFNVNTVADLTRAEELWQRHESSR